MRIQTSWFKHGDLNIRIQPAPCHRLLLGSCFSIFFLFFSLYSFISLDWNRSYKINDFFKFSTSIFLSGCAGNGNWRLDSGIQSRIWLAFGLPDLLVILLLSAKSLEGVNQGLSQCIKKSKRHSTNIMWVPIWSWLYLKFDCSIQLQGDYQTVSSTVIGWAGSSFRLVRGFWTLWCSCLV